MPIEPPINLLPMDVQREGYSVLRRRGVRDLTPAQLRGRLVHQAALVETGGRKD